MEDGCSFHVQTTTRRASATHPSRVRYASVTVPLRPRSVWLHINRVTQHKPAAVMTTFSDHLPQRRVWGATRQNSDDMDTLRRNRDTMRRNGRTEEHSWKRLLRVSDCALHGKLGSAETFIERTSRRELRKVVLWQDIAESSWEFVWAVKCGGFVKTEKQPFI